MALALMLVPLFGSLARADCAERTTRLSSLLATGALAQAEAMLNEPVARSGCAPSDLRLQRRLVADALVAEAARRGNDAAAQQMIERAVALRTSWKALVAYGDMLTGRRDFVAAAGAYQEALNLVAAGDEADIRAIPRATLERLGRQAGEARHLAATGSRGVLVAAPADLRSGAPGGVYSTVLNRGVEAFRLPSPIQFEYNSVEFSDVGSKAAEEVAAYFKEAKPASIVVVGHTDRVGGDAFNLDLSIRRARKVADYLKSAGVTAAITAQGKGKTEPRVLSDPSAYDQGEIDALNRRVEFDLKP